MITNHTTSTVLPITKTQTSTTAMPQNINLRVENIEPIIESLKDIKMWIILIAIIILKVIVIKIIKICRSAYNIHNEKVIQRHNRVSPRL